MDLSQIAGFTPQQLLTIVVVVGLLSVANWIRSRGSQSKLKLEFDGKLNLAKVEADRQIEVAKAESNRQIEVAKADLERGRQERERLSLTISDDEAKRNDATMNRFATAIEALTAVSGQATSATTKMATAAEGTNRLLEVILKTQENTRKTQEEARDTHLRNSTLIGNIERANTEGMSALSTKLDVQSATLAAANAETVRTLTSEIRQSETGTSQAIMDATKTILADVDKGQSTTQSMLTLLRELKDMLGQNGRAAKIDEISGLAIEIRDMLIDVTKHIKNGTGPLPALAAHAVTMSPSEPMAHVVKRDTGKLTALPPPKPEGT